MLDDVAPQLEALGNAKRLAAYRLLVSAGPAGLAVGALQAGSAFRPRHCRIICTG